MANGTVNISLERNLILIEFQKKLNVCVFLEDLTLENENFQSKSESMTRRSGIDNYKCLLMLISSCTCNFGWWDKLKSICSGEEYIRNTNISKASSQFPFVVLSQSTCSYI